MLTIFLSWISMLDTRHTLLWCFIRFVTNWPIILWHFLQIHHRWAHPLWHFIKFIMNVDPIVQSAWTHILYFAYMVWIYHIGPTYHICTIKKLFYYQNIILCHLGGPHDTLTSGWPRCQVSLGWIFLDETQKGVGMGFEPVTAWSSEASTTGLLLWHCCDAS
jgi:hypothetical protein